jgi:hypothetical protein
LIEPVSTQELRGAVLGYLREWWRPLLAHPSRLEHSDYQAYAVLSMCRALHTLRCGEIVSKPAAARWAQAAYGSIWGSLIQRALDWLPGIELTASRETAAWIRFTLREAGV